MASPCTGCRKATSAGTSSVPLKVNTASPTVSGTVLRSTTTQPRPASTISPVPPDCFRASNSGSDKRHTRTSHGPATAQCPAVAWSSNLRAGADLGSTGSGETAESSARLRPFMGFRGPGGSVPPGTSAGPCGLLRSPVLLAASGSLNRNWTTSPWRNPASASSTSSRPGKRPTVHFVQDRAGFDAGKGQHVSVIRNIDGVQGHVEIACLLIRNRMQDRLADGDVLGRRDRMQISHFDGEFQYASLPSPRPVPPNGPRCCRELRFQLHETGEFHALPSESGCHRAATDPRPAIPLTMERTTSKPNRAALGRLRAALRSRP